MITVRWMTLATQDRQHDISDARQGQTAAPIGTAAQVDEMQAATASGNW
jgi:hypothetical protein